MNQTTHNLYDNNRCHGIRAGFCQFVIGIVATVSFVYMGFPEFALANVMDIIEGMSPASVSIEALNEEGKLITRQSGYLVSADGVIVTTFSGISGASKINVYSGKKTLNFEGILHTYKDNDLTIIKAATDGSIAPLELSRNGKLSAGDKTYVLSNPDGLGTTITTGTFTAFIEPMKDQKMLLLSIPTGTGSAGGAVLNERGNLIGTVILALGNNITIAVPSSTVMEEHLQKTAVPLKFRADDDYVSSYTYLHLLGDIYMSIKMDQQAVVAYKKAIMVSPEPLGAYRRLAYAYGNLGLFNEAIDTLKTALSIAPDDIDMHRNLGIAYGNIGNYDAAIEAFNDTIKLDPEDAPSFYFLGLAYDELGMSLESINAYKENIRLDPQNITAYSNLALVYGNLDRNVESARTLEEALEIAPDDPLLLYNLAVTYLILNKRESAQTIYEDLKNINPQMADSLKELLDTR